MQYFNAISTFIPFGLVWFYSCFNKISRTFAGENEQDNVKWHIWVVFGSLLNVHLKKLPWNHFS